MKVEITAGTTDLISAVASSAAVVIAVWLAYQANRKADKLGRITAFRDALPLREMSSATWSVIGACQELHDVWRRHETHRERASAASRLAYEYRTGFGAGAALTPAQRSVEETAQLEIEREQNAKRVRLGQRVNDIRAHCHREAATLRDVAKSCRALLSVRDKSGREVGLALTDGEMSPLHALVKAPSRIAELKADPATRARVLEACKALRAAIDDTLLESFAQGEARPSPRAWHAMRVLDRA